MRALTVSAFRLKGLTMSKRVLICGFRCPLDLPSRPKSPFKSLGNRSLANPLGIRRVARTSSGRVVRRFPLARRLSLDSEVCINERDCKLDYNLRVVKCEVESLELILPLCNLKLNLKRYVVFEAFGNMLLDESSMWL
jgi:hypothetical protein